MLVILFCNVIAITRTNHAPNYIILLCNYIENWDAELVRSEKLIRDKV